MLYGWATFDDLNPPKIVKELSILYLQSQKRHSGVMHLIWEKETRNNEYLML